MQVTDNKNALKIGLGTASLVDIPEIEAVKVIVAAYEKGVRYFDTSPFYGDGLAEQRLGMALQHIGTDIVISTKCGHFRKTGGGLFPIRDRPWFDFSEQTMRASIEQSCIRLGRNELDVVLLHDVEGAPEQAFSEGLPVLRALQANGRIGKVGAGCNSVAGLLSAVEHAACDWLLVAGRWTILDRTAGSELLTKANDAGSHIVVGGVLNSGCMADPNHPNATFDYRPIQPEERSAAQAIKIAADQFHVSHITAALQFPIRDQRADSLLLGAASVEQINASVDALKASIPDEFWALIEKMGLQS